MFGRSRKPKELNRFRVGKGSPVLKAVMYRMMNKSYLDIRIYRGYREVTRIVTHDTGMRRFVVDGVGAFLMPNEDQMLRQLHDRHALYINYNINSSAPGEVTDELEPIAFVYPPLSPAEFQTELEAQTVADLLAETEKDNSWIWLLAGGAVLIFVIILLFGGA